ncbi:MAG: DUF21 domain-containing protein [Planctomycetes bacterium]|nr:DUF21 domain-containing protein [Planctomycetota bacterium]
MTPATLLLLLALSALFSGTETALFSLQHADREALRRSAPRRSRIVEAWLERPRRLLLTLLLCNVVVNVAYFAIVGQRAIEETGWTATAWTAIPLATLILLGEITPKIVAQSHPRAFTLLAVEPMRPVVALLAPLATVLNRPVSFLLRGVGTDAHRVTEEDLRAALSLPRGETALRPAQVRLLCDVISFEGQQVREVMTPRADVPVLRPDTTHEEALATFRAASCTWLPVGVPADEPPGKPPGKGGTTPPAGLLKLKTCWDHPEAAVHSLMLDLPRIGSSASLEEALETLRAGHVPAAVVVDERGAATGFVTIEAIVEEIVGDLTDEFDLAPPPLRRIGPGRWQVLARCPLRVLREEIGSTPEGASTTTVGGWVQASLARPARVGDVVAWPPWRFEVATVRHHAVQELTLTRKEPT